MRNTFIALTLFMFFVGLYARSIVKTAERNNHHFQSIEEQIIEKHHYHSRICEELKEVVDEAVKDGDFSEHDAAVFMNNCYTRGA